jgi:glyoxylase-like metal-dependent hydrolase (beta-lactamase superfamily II)
VVQSGQAVLVDDGYDVTSKLSVEAAPGHSPGHVLFKLADAGRRAVFCGDVIHHALQVYAPHWNHMADERPADAAVSRRRLLESCAEHDALLFPIHFGAAFRHGSCKARRETGGRVPKLVHFPPVRARVWSSLPGLTRQSISFAIDLLRRMDGPAGQARG